MRQYAYTAAALADRDPTARAVLPMRFGPARDRPHEDRPLTAGYQTASVLIAFHARPEVDVGAVAAEIEDIVRERLDRWYAARGHTLLEAAPDVA